MTDQMESSTSFTTNKHELPSGGRSVLRGAFAILDVLQVAGEAGPTELARATNLPKASVHRLLQQLHELGAVEKRNGRYSMGPRVHSLARSWHPSPALMAAIREPLPRLARATGACVGVGVWVHGHVVLVRGVPGEVIGLAPQDQSGATWPRHTAAAKALLAWQPAPPRPADVVLSAQEAQAVRERRVVFDREEVVEGVACVAVPIMHPTGRRPVAVLAAMVRPDESLPRLARTLRRVGDGISTALPAFQGRIDGNIPGASH
ncbi:IclR family transcriptional regulator [Kitasatospora sp. NPDC058965]|uniref:IclR family transcriptional regulator n=1 Tax=Kitasatospora sp. NPDC058965 TaxID=3346682 RepID=UPI00367B64EC